MNRYKIVVIGASLGGTEALKVLLAGLGESFPLITRNWKVQHFILHLDNMNARNKRLSRREVPPKSGGTNSERKVFLRNEKIAQ